MALFVSADQEAMLIAIDSVLDQALGDGVKQNLFPNATILNEMTGYDSSSPIGSPPTSLTPAQRAEVRHAFKLLAAAIIVQINVDHPFDFIPDNPVTGSVTLAKITPGGANGSLTFVGGMIVSFTAPT